jgi:hypothetical protein
MAYALVEELRQVLDLPPEDTSVDVDLQRALDSGAVWIDWFTGRTFGTTGTPAAPAFRIYAATTDATVDVVDLRSMLPTVDVDTAGDRTFATTLLPAQFIVSPYDGPPFDQIRTWADPAGAVEAVVLVPGQLVKVTGVWGYVDARGRTPANVAEANLLLGARWYKRREAPFQVLQQGEVDAYQIVRQQDTDVASLLFPVARPGSPGALLVASQAAVAGALYGAEWVMV